MAMKKPKSSIHAEDVAFEEIKDDKTKPAEEKKPEPAKKNEKKEDEIEVDLGDKKDRQKEQEKQTINFMDNSAMNDFVKAKTKTSESEEKSDEKKDDGKTVDDLRKEVKDYEENSANRFTKQDFEEFATVFMDLLDLGLSTLMRLYAKDTSTSAYQIDAVAKKRIIYQLTLLFVKYQTKFSIEFMLIITILICYSVPFSRARDMRKSQIAYQAALEESGDDGEESGEDKKPKNGMRRPGNPRRKS